MIGGSRLSRRGSVWTCANVKLGASSPDGTRLSPRLVALSEETPMRLLMPEKALRNKSTCKKVLTNPLGSAHVADG